MTEKTPSISRITKVYAHNFRSLRSVEVELSPLTVLVGPNASGKSNFVDVLRFVADALRLGLDDAITRRHGIAAFRRWSAKGKPYDMEVGLSIKTPDGRGDYRFTLGSAPFGQYRVKREYSMVSGNGRRVPLELEVRDGKLVKPPTETPIPLEPTTLALPVMRQVPRLFYSEERFFRVLKTYRRSMMLLGDNFYFLTNMRFYHIFPNVFREPQKPGIAYPLDEHGENLASVLKAMLRKKSPSLAHLKEALGNVIPGVCDLNVIQIGGYLVIKLKHATEASDQGGAWFDLSQESDGTLRLLSLLVALYQDPSPSLIAIEEPELTIHPGALAVLADLLQEAAQRSQIVVTTHSPDLIDRLPIESIRAVESVEGTTQIAPVAKYQLKAVKRRLFSPGEILRMEGFQRATGQR